MDFLNKAWKRGEGCHDFSYQVHEFSYVKFQDNDSIVKCKIFSHGLGWWEDNQFSHGCWGVGHK